MSVSRMGPLVGIAGDAILIGEVIVGWRVRRLRIAGPEAVPGQPLRKAS